MWSRIKDRGAAAVEFALVLPILMAIALGIMDLSMAWSNSLSLSNAAREGVRSLAILQKADAARITALNALPTHIVGATVTFSSPCYGGAEQFVTATVAYNNKLFSGPTVPLKAKATMRCGG